MIRKRSLLARVKNDVTKELLIMEEEQILQFSTCSSNELMAKLPQHIQKLKSSSNIRQKGFLHEE